MRYILTGFLCLLLATCIASADDIDVAANEANELSWLEEAALPFAGGIHAGLPLYVAQVYEELPSRAEYLELENACSYYCCAPEIRISASSVLAAAGELGYGAEMGWDYDLHTAWVEGHTDSGVGESLAFELFTTGENPDGAPFGKQFLNGLEIVNGYAKSPELHAANACPTMLRLWFNGEPVYCLELLDTMDIQAVTFPPLWLRDSANCELRLEILEVRAGAKYQDTAISEVVLRGGPCH